MKRNIAIIGGGIVGTSAAYFLSSLPENSNVNVTLFDDGKGQATKAAAGIISPWLSKRRNKNWYELAKAGAKVVSDIAKDTDMDQETYANNGTIITRKDENAVQALYDLAMQRRKSAPQIGNIQKISRTEIINKIPIINNSPYDGIFISGGSHIKGDLYCDHLLKIAQKNNLTVKQGYAKLVNDHKINFNNKLYNFDKIIVATGAWAKQTLIPLNINVHVRAQKGQLIELKLNGNTNVKNMPVMMPESEFDFIPLNNNKLIIGATHDDEQKFDLKIEDKVTKKLIKTAKNLITNVSDKNVIDISVGTRAYTNDYGPFFGPIPSHDSILIASGLGSSGLTTGPMIGKLLAKAIFSYEINYDKYEKPISNYIS